MIKYDEQRKCIVVPALGNVPLEYVPASKFINVDEKPLNIFSVFSTACGHTVAAGRAGTWTITSVFNAEEVFYTQVIARGDSVTVAGMHDAGA